MGRSPMATAERDTRPAYSLPVVALQFQALRGAYLALALLRGAGRCVPQMPLCVLRKRLFKAPRYPLF
ncbi:MAG: hypothetical protein RLZZ573_535 [Pseudomonadota bacterium]